MGTAEDHGSGEDCRAYHLGVDGKWVTPSTKRNADEDEDAEAVDCGGLLGHVTAYHIRILTENVMNGGGGYTYDEVGRMTLDQVWHRLCDMDILKNPVGGRVKTYQGKSAISVLTRDDDGLIKGRDADGNPIKAKMGGKSVARQLMEAEAERKKQEQEKKNRRKQRRKR